MTALRLKPPKPRRKPKLSPYQRALIERVMASDPPIVCACRGANGILHYSLGNGGPAAKKSVLRLIARQILVSNQDGLIADDPQSYRLNFTAIHAYVQSHKTQKTQEAA